MSTCNSDTWRGHAAYGFKTIPSPSSSFSPANWNNKLYSPPMPSSPSQSPRGASVPSPSSTSSLSPRTPSTPSRQAFPQFPVPNTNAVIPTPTPTVTLPLNNANCIAILEGMLGKEHTLCLQVRSLSATIAKLTKDVLATGSACPDAFVVILKDQVAKLHSLMSMLAVIEENKKAFPSSFVNEVTVQWNQRFAKQKAGSSRKRKSTETKGKQGSDMEVKLSSDEQLPPPAAKQRKIFVVIPDCKTQSLKLENSNSPKELMSINNIIN